MQKIFATMTVLACVFALAVPAMADNICVPCTKCQPYIIGCPSGGDQGGAESCYEGDRYNVPAVAGDGSFSTGEGVFDACPVIFDICECEDNSVFVPGALVDVRMTLLVNGSSGNRGAYFNEAYSGNIIMSNDNAFLCAQGCDGSTVIGSLTASDASTAWYCDNIGDLQGSRQSNEPVYRGVAPTTAHYAIWNGTAYYEVSPSFSNTCPLAASEKVVRVAVDNVALYQIDEDYGMCNWALDVPNVIVTPDLNENVCNTISLKVELLIDAGGSICSESVAECSCVYDLYKTCCETVSYRLIFPYFTSLSYDAYWNGIVIANISSKAGTATLTAREQDGSVGTFTTPVAAYSMYVSMLDSIPWAGSGLGNCRCFIDVTTDFDSRGFAMMADRYNHESMGYVVKE